MQQATINCEGREVPHNTVPWRIATNRHPNTDGTSWGWIDGAPGNVCWSNSSSAFNREKAGKVVVEHNRWLEEQKPIELRIIEATERVDAARRKADAARQEADKFAAALDVALGEVMQLEARREEASNATLNDPQGPNER